MTFFWQTAVNVILCAMCTIY